MPPERRTALLTGVVAGACILVLLLVLGLMALLSPLG